MQGVCGSRFQTPFASPPGIGESSALVNAAWGLANFAIGGVLLHAFFPAKLPPSWPLCLAAFVGAAAIALFSAHHFGKVRNTAPHP